MYRNLTNRVVVPLCFLLGVLSGCGGSPSAGVPPPVPAVAGISLSPASIQGGADAMATVTLNRAAPAGGIMVALSSGNGAAIVP